MKRLLVLALVVVLGATACGSSKKSSSKGGSTSVTISNEQGTTWTCGFNPFNANVNFLSFGPVYEELTFVNGLKSGQTTQLARLLLRVEQQQPDAHLHDAPEPEVDRRQAADGSGRALHVQPAEEPRRARPERRLVGAEERQPAGQQQGRLHLQGPGGAVLLLHRRADADRAAAHLVEDREPGHLQGRPPGRLGRVHDELVLAAGDQVPEEPELLAGGQAVDRHRLLPGVHLERPGQPAARERQGPVGQPVHPEHQHVLPEEERGQPLLVPAARQRLDLRQPEGPGAVERRGAEGDGLRDRPREGRGDRRVRLRAGLEPDGHRHADLQRLARPGRSPSRSTTTRRRRSRSCSRPASRRSTASTSRPTASRSRSTS